MKVIVAGGRDFTDETTMHKELVKLFDAGVFDEHAELVCGMARGADMTANHLWTAIYRNKIHEFYPDWNGLGKRAGFVRNKQMGDFADILIAFWDGESRGTKHMIDYMRSLGKPVYVIPYEIVNIKELLS